MRDLLDLLDRLVGRVLALLTTVLAPMVRVLGLLHHWHHARVSGTPPIDEAQLPPDVVALLQRMRLQIQAKDCELERKRGEIAWRDARLDKLNLELARLKRWKFGAKTEAMTAQQRALFAETLAEDEASLQAQLAALKSKLPEAPAVPKDAPRRPRRQALPEHLQRVEHRHEPADTT